MLRALALALWAQPLAAEIHVAVATNALPLAEAIAAQVDGEVHLSAGASGVLYAQIARGAPFDVFLSADAERPAALDGLEHRTYALGRLVIWPAGALEGAERVAIANPRLAPYGRAAEEALAALGFSDVPVVMGQNVGQTVALVASGNVPVGVVARSLKPDGEPLPATLHGPIRQDGVLLTEVGRPFWEALFSAEGQAVVEAQGYDLP